MTDSGSWLASYEAWERDGSDDEGLDLARSAFAIVQAADTLASLAPDVWYDQATAFTCTEANALAHVLRTVGLEDVADTFIAEHAAGDDEGDEHYGGQLMPREKQLDDDVLYALLVAVGINAQRDHFQEPFDGRNDCPAVEDKPCTCGKTEAELALAMVPDDLRLRVQKAVDVILISGMAPEECVRPQTEEAN